MVRKRGVAQAADSPYRRLFARQFRVGGSCVFYAHTFIGPSWICTSSLAKGFAHREGTVSETLG